jgi:hypothetical protein
MSKSVDSSIPSDIRLLLRADAEQCWLHREVIPVLQHLEARKLLPEEEVCAALAYLEAMWDEATSRAQETDAAHAHLRARHDEHAMLSGPAGRYHAAVRVLRGIVAERVTPLVEPSLKPNTLGGSSERQVKSNNRGLRVQDVRANGRRPARGVDLLAPQRASGHGETTPRGRDLGPWGMATRRRHYDRVRFAPCPTQPAPKRCALTCSRIQPARTVCSIPPASWRPPRTRG